MIIVIIVIKVVIIVIKVVIIVVLLNSNSDELTLRLANLYILFSELAPPVLSISSNLFS